MGCCCFTESKDNLPMWYHYAGQYSGVCIEYDMTKFHEFDLPRRLMHPVKYTKELPDIDNEIKNFKPEYANLYTWVTLHKLIDWNYEHEWRLVYNGVYREDTNIKFPVISAIYLGIKIKAEHRKIILELANNMKIENNKVTYVPLLRLN